MSKPGTTPANRISRDSGICCEDSDPSKSSTSSSSSLNKGSATATRAVKKRFPAGGGGGRTTAKTASSYVRRLTQHFEFLTTCNDECDQRSSPSSTLERTAPPPPQRAYQSDWSLHLAKEAPEEEEEEKQEEVVVPEAEVEQPVPSVFVVDEKCDTEKEEEMDEAVQVIQNIYEDVLKRDQYHLGGSTRSVSHLIAEYDQPVAEAENGNGCASDKFEEEELQNEANRDVEFGEEPSESTPQPIEAQNSFIAQRASHFDHHYDDTEFSDTDSFDSTDDEEDFLAKSRPDSNSSIQSERTTNIMKELLENEQNYVQTLERGIENYVSVMQQKELPIGLKGLRYHIFGNIERIHQFHRDSFLPRLRQNQASIQGIAETFIKFIEDDRFYCYIMFALNRPKSERICEKNREFFQEIQNQAGDKLGLNSFLLQPIQRLPRYKLLLAEINKEVLKLIADNLIDTVKNEIGVLCKAEKRLEKFIDVLNEAMSINDIRECYELNLYQQGKFRKMFEMDIYDWDRRRRYPGKVFFFEKCILYAEKMKDYLEYRGHYVDSEVGLYNDGKSKLCVFVKKRGMQEVEFSASDMGVVQNMAAYIEGVMRGFASQERQRINDLSRKKDWKDQRIPSVMIVNRGSALSNRSTLSVGSSEYSRESHEPVSQTIWDSEKPVQSLVSAQKHFCQILAANRKYYFNELPEELANKVHRFVSVFDRLQEIHTKRVYEDFAHPNVGVDDVCELFILYFKEDLFEPYNTYLKVFKKAAGIMKNIHKASRTSLSDGMVAQSTDEFTFLLIDIWNKYRDFIQTQIVRLSEQMNNAVQDADKELFRKLAFIELQITAFRTTLVQNYKMFNLDETLPAASIGLVQYSDRVRFGNETMSSHRMFICDKATVCVKIQMVREIDRQVEKYVRIVLSDKFRPGVLVVKLSKKSEVRLNFETNGNKHPVDFGSRANRDKFYGNYCMVYGKCVNSKPR